jgi:hypothetical protein
MTKRINYRKIWEEYNNKKIPNGYHIHHIDGNRENNAPSNLECLSPEDHYLKHMELGLPYKGMSKGWIVGASEAGKKGGKNGKGWKHTKQTSEKLSASLKLSYQERGGSPLKGRKISESTKKKISIATKGENNPIYGKKRSDEVKEKISKTKKQKWISGEYDHIEHKKHNEETKKLISEKRKALFNSGFKNHTAKRYNVYNEKEQMILTRVYKEDIIKHLNISDRQYKTLLKFTNCSGGKLHPKLKIRLEKLC